MDRCTVECISNGPIIVGVELHADSAFSHLKPNANNAMVLVNVLRITPHDYALPVVELLLLTPWCEWLSGDSASCSVPASPAALAAAAGASQSPSSRSSTGLRGGGHSRRYRPVHGNVENAERGVHVSSGASSQPLSSSYLPC